jgi:hypothetical protein
LIRSSPKERSARKASTPAVMNIKEREMSEAPTVSEMAIVPESIAERIVSPAAFAEWNGINADFDFLRQELPLAKASPRGYDPFWVVTKYADVK